MSSPSPAPRRLVRPLGQAQVAGVAAGLGEHLRTTPVAIRVVLVLLAPWQFIGVVIYFALWLAIPPAPAAQAAPGVEAATRTGFRTPRVAVTRGGVDVGQLIALALLGAGVTWLLQVLGWGLSPYWLLVGGLVTLACGLVWWHADRAQGTPSEAAAGFSGWVRPLLAHWSTVLAHGVAVLAMAAAITLALLPLPNPGTVGLLLVTLAMGLSGVLLLAAPWVLRARRALSGVRQEKLIADARADMAAHLHDSVLQTLALIQRQSGNAREVARLARRQERELRAWLYDGLEEAGTLRVALMQAAGEVEDDFPVAVECVTVGEDVALTPALGELVKAAREAMVNAAKHSGAGVVDVYAEVGAESVEVFVRDRGRGFDIESIAEDRLGVRRSILDRMDRHHGAAHIRSHPDRGTEVSLEMRR